MGLWHHWYYHRLLWMIQGVEHCSANWKMQQIRWEESEKGANVNVICVVFQDNVDLGDLMFSLCYLPTAGRLTITMIKARNLKAMDITGASGKWREGSWSARVLNEAEPLAFCLLLLVQIHMWRFPSCVKDGGWRRGRRPPKETLWIPSTTRPLSLTSPQKT